MFCNSRSLQEVYLTSKQKELQWNFTNKLKELYSIRSIPALAQEVGNILKRLNILEGIWRKPDDEGVFAVDTEIAGMSITAMDVDEARSALTTLLQEKAKHELNAANAHDILTALFVTYIVVLQDHFVATRAMEVANIIDQHTTKSDNSERLLAVASRCIRHQCEVYTSDKPKRTVAVASRSPASSSSSAMIVYGDSVASAHALAPCRNWQCALPILARTVVPTRLQVTMTEIKYHTYRII